MSNVAITIKNGEKIERAFKNAPAELAQAIQKALDQTSGTTLGAVKRVIYTGTDMWKSPVDTGKMVGGITIAEMSPMRVVIKPNISVTPYAVFVHEGTSKMTARPFLDITVNTEGKNIADFFKRTLDMFVVELANKMK